MSEQFGVCLRELSCGVAEEVAFGRRLRNEAVTVDKLHEHCGKELAERVAGRHVLAIQDTTELNDQRHARRTRGLGTVGNGTDVGLFLHPTLAIDGENGAATFQSSIYPKRAMPPHAARRLAAPLYRVIRSTPPQSPSE
jgi:hypothetical protein